MARGLNSIPYPGPLKVIEVVSILLVLAVIPLLAIRSLYVPIVAILSLVGGLLVARHDATVPGQRGTLELVTMTIFAIVWLVLAGAAFITKDPDSRPNR